MTPKERAAMQQALEALEELHYSSGTVVAARMYEIATAALREALAEQAECPHGVDDGACKECYMEQAEQEPVEGVLPCPFCGCIDVSVNEGSTFRWRYAMCDNCGAQAGEVRFDTLAEHTAAAEEQAHKDAIEEWNSRAASVRTKDLTDDEIYTLYSEPCSDREMVEFARAVIAADREKNK